MSQLSVVGGRKSTGQPGAVVSLGSINADFQVCVERRPDIGETLVGHRFEQLGGGKAANVAYLARRLGIGARLFGHVGEDDLAEQALAPLRAMGVDLSDVVQLKNRATGVAMISVPPDGNKGIVLAPNANGIWNAQDAAGIERALDQLPATSVLVADCEVPPFVVERAVAHARRRGCKVVLDPSPAARVSHDLIASADLITPNTSEAEQLLGVACDNVDSAKRAGLSLLERGAGAACMKLPQGGCVLVDGRSAVHVDAVPVEVVDTSGAGDAFAGALAVALVERLPLLEAARFAVAASHLAVTVYGSQRALPEREQIEQMAKRLQVLPLSE